MDGRVDGGVDGRVDGGVDGGVDGRVARDPKIQNSLKHNFNKK